MNDDRQPERTAVRSAAARAGAADPLAQLKRASLRNEAMRAAWQLGSLVRRVEHEAPEVHRRLRCAVEALQLLGAKLALADSGGVAPAVAAQRSEVGCERAALAEGDSPAAETGAEGEAELF